MTKNTFDIIIYFLFFKVQAETKIKKLEEELAFVDLFISPKSSEAQKMMADDEVQNPGENEEHQKSSSNKLELIESNSEFLKSKLQSIKSKNQDLISEQLTLLSEAQSNFKENEGNVCISRQSLILNPEDPDR